ncbi:MAG: ATP-grasp domain-containing protein [Candidatus Delongbacteria bacterium]|nr:ATP-grasp domain-containing protein [Candidatus Delongbacteria bacterium]MBN2836617.1 ATP-grasp domain-containing protein [Candidatus Delongbacteria bacterium]
MITIAVSGINAIDNPGPGIGIIRSLKESNLEVRTIGFAYDAMEPGIYLDQYVDKSYLLPYPSAGRETFLERILQIHEIEKIDVIISALDAELPLYIEIEKQLRSYGIKMLIPTREMFALRNKNALKGVAKSVNIEIPAYLTCNSYNDLVKGMEETGFPCMIKGPFYEAFKATSESEATTYFNKLITKWGFPIIVQKFVEGEEYNVIGCGDGKGNTMGLFAIRKMTTTSLGKVWNAVSINNERLLKSAEDVVKYLNWKGGFEFEVIIDNETDEINLIEINPRFPAWVYMASACGVNLPERMVQLLIGENYETSSDYSSGKIMIRYTMETIKEISDFEKITTFGEL